MKNTTRNMLGCLGLIVLALLSGACKEPPVSVPNVVGMVQAAAEAAIVQAKLTVGAVTIEYHTMAPRGQVVSQNPAPGSRVAPQSAVDITVAGAYSGGDGSSDAPYLISVVQDLLDLANPDNKADWDKHFLMTTDIDMTGVTECTPIGNDIEPFEGTLEGNGYAIRNLVIELPAQDYVGLFGYLHGGTLQNIGLEGGSVVGDEKVGGLVGFSVDGTVSNCYATGAVTGTITVGGLIGYSDSESPVMQCYATGVVTAPQHAGGLIGRNFGPVTLCYATGAVAGDQYAGGLMAENRAPVSDCYATGTVTGDSGVGGLVGINYLGTVSDCYATGMVTGNFSVGGLVGDNDSGSVTASFWDTETTGTAISAGGEGKTTAEMMAETTFTDVGWDFSDVWYMLEGGSYPFLVGNPEVK